LRTASLRSPTTSDVPRPWTRFAIGFLRKLIGGLSLLIAGPGTLLLVLLMLFMLRDWQGFAGGAPGRGTFPLIATFAVAFLVSVGLGVAGLLTLSGRRAWIGFSIVAWASWSTMVAFVGAVYVWETHPVTYDPTMLLLLSVLGSPAIVAIPGAVVAQRLSRTLDGEGELRLPDTFATRT
jgi:hypothetical protein